MINNEKSALGGKMKKTMFFVVVILSTIFGIDIQVADAYGRDECLKEGGYCYEKECPSDEYSFALGKPGDFGCDAKVGDVCCHNEDLTSSRMCRFLKENDKCNVRTAMYGYELGYCTRGLSAFGEPVLYCSIHGSVKECAGKPNGTPCKTIKRGQEDYLSPYCSNNVCGSTFDYSDDSTSSAQLIDETSSSAPVAALGGDSLLGVSNWLSSDSAQTSGDQQCGGACQVACSNNQTEQPGPIASCNGMKCCVNKGAPVQGGAASISDPFAIPDVGLPNPSGGVKQVLENVLRWLLGIVGVIALIGFVVSGIQYVVSTGSEDMMESAKRNMVYSIIGVVVVLSSFVIIQAINYALEAKSFF